MVNEQSVVQRLSVVCCCGGSGKTEMLMLARVFDAEKYSDWVWIGNCFVVMCVCVRAHKGKREKYYVCPINYITKTEWMETSGWCLHDICVSLGSNP